MSRSAWTSSARTRPTALGRSTSSAASTGVWPSTISSALSTGTTLSTPNHSIGTRKEQEAGSSERRIDSDASDLGGARMRAGGCFARSYPPELHYDHRMVPTVEWQDGE